MSFININKTAFFHNIDLIREVASSIDEHLEVACVFKDNAYGHGLGIMSNLAKDKGIDIICVKNTAEAKSIEARVKEVLIFYSQLDEIASYVREEERPEFIYSIHSLSALKALPRALLTKIAIKVNIGLNRNGIEVDEVKDALDIVHEKRLRLHSIFSHSGYADGKQQRFIDFINEWNAFKERVVALAKGYEDYYLDRGSKNGTSIRFHSLNSSGLFNYARYKAEHKERLKDIIEDDFIRIGGANYGYESSGEGARLRKVAALYAERITTRELKAGSHLGYDGVGMVSVKSVVTTYDVGYGDGFFRVQKEGLQTARGFPILPKTSMDCMSVLGAKESVICIFDDANIIALFFDTIAYDVLTRLCPLIPRHVISDEDLA